MLKKEQFPEYSNSPRVRPPSNMVPPITTPLQQMPPLQVSCQQPFFAPDSPFNYPEIMPGSPFPQMYSPFMNGVCLPSPSYLPMTPVTPVNVVYTNEIVGHNSRMYSQELPPNTESKGENGNMVRSMNDNSNALPDAKTLLLTKAQSSTCLDVMDETQQQLQLQQQTIENTLPAPPILEKGQSGQYVAFACDRRQSLKLQKMIADAKAKRNYDLIESMYCQFLPEILRLARDQFANFVLQRFIETLRIDLVDSLAEKIKRDAVAMATNQFACRVLQSVLSHCSSKYRDELTACILPDAQELLRDNFGCYVLQRIIETKPSNQLNEFVNEHIIPQYFDLSVHQHGGRVVQHIFRYFQPEDKTEITNCVLRGILALCKNGYGNYVVQKMIHYGDFELRGRVVEALLPHVPELCCNKAGSNILEKCLSKVTPQQKITLMRPIIENEENLKKIVSDKYGNYVLQRMMVSLPYQKRQDLFQVLNNYFDGRDFETLNSYENHVHEQLVKVSQD